MSFEIADIAAADFAPVLELNAAEVPHVGQIDEDQLRWFAENAAYLRVARRGAALAGFLIGLRPGTEYKSPNYRWFCDRYDDFAYVDRVAVATTARRTGLASRLYEDFAASLPATVPLMTCEVNIEPPNEGSMRFHRKLGFRQVGRLIAADGSKTVAMLAKNL